jgi:hypothetical protein
MTLPKKGLRSLGNLTNMLPHEFLATLSNGDARLVANNTWVAVAINQDMNVRNTVIYLSHHSTNIMYCYPPSMSLSGLHCKPGVFSTPDPLIRIDCQDWRSVTTKRRLNLVLPNSISIFSVDHEWRIRVGYRPTQSIPFYDRILIGFHDNDVDDPYILE